MCLSNTIVVGISLFSKGPPPLLCFCFHPVSSTHSPFRLRIISASHRFILVYPFLLNHQSGFPMMKAYTLCLLALAVVSSARPKTTTAFPTLSSGVGSSAVKKTSYQDTSDYSEKSEQSPGGSNPGNSGSQSLGSGPSGVAGSGPVSTGTSSTGNTTTGGAISNGKITLPANCQSVNNIGFGWLPDYNGASLADDETAVGNKNPCFAGYYGQTGLSGWNDGAQITDNIAVSMSVLIVCKVLADTLARTLSPVVNLIRSSLLRSCHRGLLLINSRRARPSLLLLQMP